MMLAAGNVQLSDLPNHCRLMQRREQGGVGPGFLFCKWLERAVPASRLDWHG